MDKKKISVMIPCYNEEENARPIYEAVKNELVTKLPQYDYEILFIDNKSTDNTRSIIRGICKEDKNVRAIFNCRNFGQFNSPYYGIINTSGDCCVTICADFQDPVELIPKFVAEWEKGYKVVIGVKTQSKESKIMYALRSLYYKAIKKMSNVEQIEHFTGFGLYDKSFVKTSFNKGKGFIYNKSNNYVPRTFVTAHLAYWDTPKRFAKAIVKAFNEGYPHFYELDKN